MKFVQNLRSKSEMLKSRKEKMAAGFVSMISHHIVGQAARLIRRWQTAIDVAQVVVVAGKAVRDDEKLRGQAEAFVSHVIGDAASRINELANLCEALATREDVQEAVSVVEEAIASSRKPKKGRRHLRAVRKQPSWLRSVRTGRKGSLN